MSEGTSKSARDFEGHCQHRCLLLLPSTIMVNRTCPSRRTSERTKKCLTGHKWVQHWFPVFRDSSLSQSGVIVEAKVSDRQRRCCRNIIGCKSSFTYHVLLGFCLLSYWLQFKVRSLSFWKWFGAIWHLQPGTALSLRLRFFFFPKAGFRLHSSFADIFRRTEHNVMVQKALFRNSPVRWPFKYDATHAHFEQIQTYNLRSV